jgi:hypothetical protein
MKLQKWMIAKAVEHLCCTRDAAKRCGAQRVREIKPVKLASEASAGGSN